MKTYQTLQFGPVEGYQFGYSPLGFIKPIPVWCYYIDGLLVDTAQRHMQREVIQTFAHKPIAQIALTHFHEDHSGNADALREYHRCPVLAGPRTAERIAHGFPLLPYEHFWFGEIDPCAHTIPIPPIIETPRHALRPILTPGHSDDHYVFLEEKEGWLFAGDFYVGKLKVFRRGENIYQMIESTRAMLTHDFEVLFCAHNPVLTQGKQALERKLHYLETLVERVTEGYRRGQRGQALVRAAGLHEQWFIRAFTFNDVSAYYLVKSILNDRQ